MPRTDSERPAKMTVEEGLRGLPKGVTELTVDTHAGSSCYMRLQKGERYVIYGSPTDLAKGRVRREACSFSFAVKGNELLLAAIRGAARGAERTLAGRVVVRTDASAVGNEGAAGVRVTATAGGNRLETVANGDGEFSFPGIAAGKYALDSSGGGYVADPERWPRGDVRVGNTGCAYQRLTVAPDGRLTGTVKGPDGAPVPEVRVQAFARTRRGGMEPKPLREARTDASGVYELKGVPPGEFVVAVNGELNQDREPWAPVYHPDARTPEGAKWVALGRAEKKGGIDLRLGPPRQAATLRVDMRHADGSPVERAAVRIEDPAGRQRAFQQAEADAPQQGVIEFTVYIGERYRVVASASNARGTFGATSADFEMTEKTTGVKLVLQPENR